MAHTYPTQLVWRHKILWHDCVHVWSESTQTDTYHTDMYTQPTHALHRRRSLPTCVALSSTLLWSLSDTGMLTCSQRSHSKTPETRDLNELNQPQNKLMSDVVDANQNLALLYKKLDDAKVQLKHAQGQASFVQAEIQLLEQQHMIQARSPQNGQVPNSDWLRARDASSGRYFYIHSRLKITQWQVHNRRLVCPLSGAAHEACVCAGSVRGLARDAAATQRGA
jgi:hypothetical protein